MAAVHDARKMSRPSWSTPNGCAQLMPDSGRPVPICEKP